ncbi:hypothetical protein [Nocardia farcinica]|uniref:hypothetical protein n=2 Tax=Nocardia farcinica TaxID=37329 RepID=UPI002458F809|nr:hypothetical protein [Nocardia farcinica]
MRTFRWSTPVGIAVAATVLVAGSACTNTPPPRAAQTTTMAPATTTATPTPTSAGPVTVANPKHLPVSFRRGVLAWHCNHQFSGPGKPGPAVLRLPHNPNRAYEIPPSTVPNETVDQGDSDTCATIGEGSDLRVVYAATSFKASSGLEPEAHSLSLISYRLGQSAPATRVTVWSGRDRPVAVSLRGTASGVAVSFDIYGMNSPQVKGYEGTDLREAWSMPGTVAASTNKTYVVTTPGECTACPDKWVILAANGSVLHEPPTTIAVPLDLVTDYGYGLESPDGMLWFDEAAGRIPDGAAGALRNASGLLPDPMTPMIVVKYSEAGKPMFKVLDRTTWQELLVIDADRTAGLRIDSVALYDGHLYIRNSSDSPVIRVSGSQVVAKGWQVLPVGRIGDTTVLAHAPAAIGSSNCVEDTLVLDGTSHHPGTPNIYGLSTCTEFTVVPDVDGKFPGPRY